MDNTEQEHLEKPEIPNPESSADEIIPKNEQKTITQNQETENMEVHHHPKVEKKNFKEYFLEFLMIFLAVTMGFFAENIREHFTEKKIARQNLEAYRNDLLQHKEHYEEKIADFNIILPVYDSIVSIFYEKKENKELPVLSRFMLQGQLNNVVIINTPTYEQLISSGSLRFIDNKKLKANMASYQAKINAYINYNDRMITTLNNQVGELGKIIDTHDLFNRENNFQIYTPEMQPFSLSAEQRRFIIAYYKLYSVQFQAGLQWMKHMHVSNTDLLKSLDEELKK